MKKISILFSFILLLTFLTLPLIFQGCKKESHLPNKTSDKKVEYYTCSMHPFIHEKKPGRCPICGMELVPVYSETLESQPFHSDEPEGKKEKKILYYIDPMHPWYKSDKPGKAPDCGMDLVPVYEEERSESKPAKVSELTTVHLSLEKQQLIGIKTEAVERRKLVREIYIPGRVAYDPDLWVAQNEYLIALRTSGGTLLEVQKSLIHATKLKLRLLGMDESQIKELKTKGKSQTSLLVPEKRDAIWIYGSIFESDLPWVKRGDPVQISIPGSSDSYQASIESIDPTIDSITRTARIRFRISNLKGNLKPDLFVRLLINAEIGNLLSIADSAILDTGTRRIAFVDRGNGKFEPRELKLGKRGTGFTEVLSGVSEGERVVTNANFLLDSESRLKASFSGIEEHQH